MRGKGALVPRDAPGEHAIAAIDFNIFPVAIKIGERSSK